MRTWGFKKIGIASLIFACTVVGQIVPQGSTAFSDFGMATAEASIFDKIGEIFSFGRDKANSSKDDIINDAKQKAIQIAKDKAKEAISKALSIDLNSLENHRESMYYYMNAAGYDLTAATYKICVVTNERKDSQLGAYENLIHEFTNDKTSIGPVYHLAEQPFDAKKVKNELMLIKMNPKNEEVMASIKQQLSWSKKDRACAVAYTALAMRDATFVTREALKGLSNIKKIDKIENLNDVDKIKSMANNLTTTFNEFKQVANDVKLLCSFIGKRKKDLDSATKEYEKAANIKDPTKEEIKSSMKFMGKE